MLCTFFPYIIKHNLADMVYFVDFFDCLVVFHLQATLHIWRNLEIPYGIGFVKLSV